jgi:hypothetical protein
LEFFARIGNKKCAISSKNGAKSSEMTGQNRQKRRDKIVDHRSSFRSHCRSCFMHTFRLSYLHRNGCSLLCLLAVHIVQYSSTLRRLFDFREDHFRFVSFVSPVFAPLALEPTRSSIPWQFDVAESAILPCRCQFPAAHEVGHMGAVPKCFTVCRCRLKIHFAISYRVT